MGGACEDDGTQEGQDHKGPMEGQEQEVPSRPMCVGGLCGRAGCAGDVAWGWVAVAGLTPCPQLRAVLHQLLQREAAADLHPDDPEGGAGGICPRGTPGPCWSGWMRPLCLCQSTAPEELSPPRGQGSAGDSPAARPSLAPLPAGSRFNSRKAGRDSGSPSLWPDIRFLPHISWGGCPWGRVCAPRVWGSMHLTPICSQGIKWTPVEFFDNSIICNLIENVSCPPVPGARFGVPAPPIIPGVNWG